MFKTRKQLVSTILNELTLVNGSSVQVYNEPIIIDYLQRGFDHLFAKRFWTHLTSTTYHNTDGVSGILTSSIVGLDQLSDIQWIREEPYSPQDEIDYFPEGVFDDALSGYTGLPYSDPQYTDKRIRIYPENTAKAVAIRARRRPDDFEDLDIIPFDPLMLVHFVSYTLLAADGMNPAAQGVQQGLFNDRYETLVANESDNKIVSGRRQYGNTFTVAEE